MKILVPAAVVGDLAALTSALPANVELIGYAEEDTEVPGAAEAEGVLRWVHGKRYERYVLEGPRVRWLHTASAGVDHVLTPALRAHGGLTLTDSGPAFGIALGEFVLAWMLSVARLPDLMAQQRRREWRWLTQEELYGQTVGIIGLGQIGRAVAVRCRAMGMRTIGLRRRAEPVPEVDAVRTGAEGLHSLLAESDWIVLAAALTEETRALLGPEAFARMKPTARLVNVARGGLLDEAGLIAALREGRIAGACLDVFAQEPLPADSPLWEIPNVYVTPHTAPGWSEVLRRRQLDLFASNLRRFAHGEPLEGVVDLARGY